MDVGYEPLGVVSRFDGVYAFLSNFYQSPVIAERKFANGHAFRGVPTVEHAYQAMKATTPADFDYVCDSQSPGVAKQRGRKIELRADWEDVKEQIMRDLLKQKFAQNSLLAGKLLSTKHAKLVEGNHWGDVYWGVCRGQGLNRLGVLLMQVRADLRVRM